MTDANGGPREQRIDPAVLAAYEVPAPSADLGDRFMDRLRVRRGARLRSARRVWLVAGVAAAGLATAAVVWLVGDRRQGVTGELTVDRRREIRLADRAVAVAEAGASLSWRIGPDGAARIEQRSGDVFYRVNPGGAFVVHTEAGEVTVRGTCFRMEVNRMRQWQKLGLAGAAGAALATAVVTVYEGNVLFANPGGRVELAAGESGAASPNSVPARVALGSAAVSGGAGLTPPPASSSVPELLARDRWQRERIASLEEEVQQLRQPARARGEEAADKHPFELTHDDLVKLAKVCDVPHDTPPMTGSTMAEMLTEKGIAEAKLTADERKAVERAIARTQPRYETELRALYSELTGESGEALDPLSMIIEIVQKSPADQLALAKKIIAEERAGLRPPPRDPSHGSVFERYLRLALGAGDNFARDLAGEMPMNRVRDFRKTWGSVNLGPGCPSGGSSR